MIDLDALLSEIAEAPPCGPDLEYDPAFLELEQASRGKPEQQYGETVVPAEEPAWGQVRALAQGLLQRTKDLRVAAAFAHSLVCTEGFAGLKPGFDLLGGLLERYWDTIHPNLDPDDDNDPTMRMNALATLADPDGLLRDLHNAQLLRTRQHGPLLVRDIEVAIEKMPAKEGVTQPSLAQITAMMATEEGVAAALAIRDTLASVKKVSAALNERVGSDRAPDFRQLIGVVASLQHVCGSVGGAADVDAAAGGEAGSENGGGASGPAVSGEIRNRQDALLMIDKIVAYLERQEPTNPAPLLLLRAKRLMNMSFVDIIRDMAPDGLGQIENIAGVRAENN